MTAQIGPDADPTTLLRSREYLKLLILAGLTGVPISAAAFYNFKFTI